MNDGLYDLDARSNTSGHGVLFAFYANIKCIGEKAMSRFIS